MDGADWEQAVSEVVAAVDRLMLLSAFGGASTPAGAGPRVRPSGGDVLPSGEVPSRSSVVPSGAEVSALAAVGHRVQAVVALAAVAFEQATEWADDGARSPARWLATACRLPQREVARWGTLGALAERIPAVAQAWVAGVIGAAHVSALAGACNRRTADAMLRDQDMLVELARTMPYADFRRALAYWLQHVDPDGCEDAELQRQQRRRVSLHQSFEGTWFGDMQLDPISGAVVAGELQRLEQQLFETDVAEAAERHEGGDDQDVAAGLGSGSGGAAEGGGPVAAAGAGSRDAGPTGSALSDDERVAGGALRRTAVQRRADALVEMALRSRRAGRRPHAAGGGHTTGNGAGITTTLNDQIITGEGATAIDGTTTADADLERDAGRSSWGGQDGCGVFPGPLFTVLVDWPTLAGRVCELANGHPLAPGALVPWLAAADLERAVWRGRARIDVAATSRLFTGATRRAIEIRDRFCAHPYCSLPAERCQVDHVVAHTDGGLTTQANGQLLCAYHNRRKELLRRRSGSPGDRSGRLPSPSRPPPGPSGLAA